MSGAPGTIMVIAGYILTVLGCIVCLVGEVMLLTVAYNRGLAWFLGCLFIPPLWLVLLAFHFGAAVKPIVITVGGVTLAWIGASMAGLDP